MLVKPHLKISLALFALLFFGSQLYAAHIHPFRTYFHELSCVVGVLLAFLPLIWVRGAQNQSYAFPKSGLLILGLMLVIALQVGFQLTPWNHVVYPSLYLLMALLAMILGATWMMALRDPEPICMTLAVAHLAAALLSVVMQNLQFLGWDLRPFIMFMAHDGVTPIRPFANVAQPNQLALLLCFALASLWWLTQTKKLKPFIAGGLTLVLLWGLALTQSRIAWLILPLFATLIFTKQIGERRLHWLPVLLLLLAYAGMVFALPLIGGALHVVTGSVIDHVGGRSERTILAKQAWAIAQQHPWFGAGWFGFGQEQVKIAADFTSTTYAEHAHNIVLNFAAELGFPVTIIFFSAIIFWLWKTCLKSGAAKDPAIGFSLLFFIAVGVHSLVEFPLWYAYVLLPIALMAGVAHQRRFGEKAGGVFRVPGWLGAGFVGISALAIVLLNYDYQRVVDGFNVLGNVSANNPLKKEKLRKPEWTALPDFYDYFRIQTTVARSDMPLAERQFAERMSGRFGFAHILSKMAEIDALNGEPEKATQLMQTLQRLHPYAYPEYFDYWQTMASNEAEYQVVFASMPARDAP